MGAGEIHSLLGYFWAHGINTQPPFPSLVGPFPLFLWECVPQRVVQARILRCLHLFPVLFLYPLLAPFGLGGGMRVRSHMRQQGPASPRGGGAASVRRRGSSQSQEKRQPPPATSRVFFFYASLAGSFGALSAVAGKLAVAERSRRAIIAVAAALLALVNVRDENARWVGAALLGIRGLLLAANVFFTAQMWRWYLKALSCGPTPVCQIVNTGMNFAVSALLGFVVFREAVTATWAVGALLVAVGLAVVVSDAGVAVQ
ncbi:uncharacterized protein Tco025E_00513 [Trypanosoma conorhini]|uniref:EamA domain-containing protein n=1 Tax=Trypanosoma conorhini TaxID=83891 RepID=A0A3R7LM13_9TRYP|nr:uncharacterized protein Tco025E_00513 [Trypanosoma conorhini]RNF27321.1 hypothetical protein Tco025E_00513 [Trypanosoma conorhini]